MMTSDATQLPDGPSGRFLPLARLIRDPRGAYGGWLEKYGDPCLVDTPNGAVLVIAKPEYVRQMFSADASHYDPFGVAALEPIVGPRSIFVLGAQAHRDERKLIMPPLHGQRMRHYGELIQQATRRAMAGVEVGGRFEVQKLGMGISMEVILRAVFGLQDAERVSRFTEVLDQLMERAHPALFFSKATQVSFLGLSPFDRLKRAEVKVNALIMAEIDRRRGDLEGRQDILSLLMSARYEGGGEVESARLRDQLMTLLVAGHETTAVALSWAMYRLHRHPRVLSKLRDELAEADGASPDQIARLPWLKAVCNETLRLHPVVPDVPRMVCKPLEIGGHLIPAGVGVSAATVITHLDPSIYPNPESFRPERFIERTFRPWEFYPFGGGHRRCIGAAFASYELALALATMVDEGRFEMLERGPVKTVRRNLTTGPETGVRMMRV